MTDFTAALDDYLATRHAMGYKLEVHRLVLRRFVAHLEAIGAEHLTIDEALRFATQSPEAAPVWSAGKLGAIRVFARYLVAVDPATEVPPVNLLPEPCHRIVPHIYSDEDLAKVLVAADHLNPEHRADTYRQVISLLAVTGMRVGEAVRLDRDEVDLERGLLTITRSKFGKSRQVPLHPTTVEALAAYGRRRDERRPNPKSESFFTSTTGTRLLRDNVSTVFPRLVREAGLAARAGHRPPRLHDLRHSFAVKTVIGWYRDGVDVEARLPRLSTYLGHVAPSTTYWYLTGVPELLELVADRLDGVVDRLER
jgi:integrase/recombinase XerD